MIPPRHERPPERDYEAVPFAYDDIRFHFYAVLLGIGSAMILMLTAGIVVFGLLKAVGWL